jgi:hypothetical protein
VHLILTVLNSALLEKLPVVLLLKNNQTFMEPKSYVRFEVFAVVTIETESEGHLPFLDLGIYRRLDGSLGHKVYSKPTHFNLYLNAKSHHHPSNKQAVLFTLVHRARALCDEESLEARLVFLRDVFKQNGYNWQIHRALQHHPHLGQPDNKSNSVAFLLSVGPILN